MDDTVQLVILFVIMCVIACLFLAAWLCAGVDALDRHLTPAATEQESNVDV